MKYFFQIGSVILEPLEYKKKQTKYVNTLLYEYRWNANKELSIKYCSLIKTSVALDFRPALNLDLNTKGICNSVSSSSSVSCNLISLFQHIQTKHDR